MLAHFALTSCLVLASAITAPGPGATHLAEGTASPHAPWTGKLEAPRATCLLLELESQADVDLDLSISGDGWATQAASHLGRELLVLPALGGEVFGLQVSAPGQHAAAFQLKITTLEPSRSLAPGESLDLRSPAEAVLLRLEGPGRVRAEGGPEGRGELVLLDQRLDLLEHVALLERQPLSLAAKSGTLALLLGRPDASFLFEPDLVPAKSPLEDFLERLASTPAQREVLQALRHNPDFLRIRTYLEHYPGGVPIRMLVVPGLKAHGIERFGTYSRGTLAINPTIVGHQTNPQELVDTLVHELVHAVLSLPRAPRFPLAPDVLDASHDFRLRALGGAPLKRGEQPEPYASYLEREYGPSASNPEEDYTDINAGAQRLIMKVIRGNLNRTGLGKQTIVFKNAREREQRLAETK